MQCFIYVWLQVSIMMTTTTWAMDFNYEDFASQFSAGSTCPSFECPVKQHVAPKSHYQVVANGCGTVGFQLQQMETMDFTECCNWHDACYATCGMQKSTCEKKFDQCLKKMCKTLQDSELRNQCQQNKAIYVMGVQVMGCQPYQDSQKEACVCVQSQEDVSTAYNARIQHLYETHGEEDLSTMTLEKTQQSLLEKYQGKEPTMLFRLLKKFPRAVNIEVPAEDANSFEHHEHDNEDRVSDGGDVEHIEL